MPESVSFMTLKSDKEEKSNYTNRGLDDQSHVELRIPQYFVNVNNSNSSFAKHPVLFTILFILFGIMSSFSTIVSVIYLSSRGQHCVPCLITPSPSMTSTSAPSHSMTSTSAPSPSMAAISTATLLPSMEVSSNATQSPSVTAIPTAQPSNFQTNDVGDYKISAQSKSHGNWLLCDGSLLDARDCPQLFDVIGYKFGSKTSTNEYVDAGNKYNLLTRFALPDAKDRVVGFSGDKYSRGDKVGSGNVTLSGDNIPVHPHTFSVETATSDCDDTDDAERYLQISTYSLTSVKHYFRISTRYSSDCSRSFETNTFGLNGSSFEVYQPTLFVGNLFIYGDAF